MEQIEAQILFNRLADRYGLARKGWILKWLTSRRALGRCYYGSHTIGLSIHHVLLCNEDEVTDTIKHEIAHALVGPGHKHDELWQAVASKIGATPERRGPANSTARSYTADCECGTRYMRDKPILAGRRLRCSCGRIIKEWKAHR